MALLRYTQNDALRAIQTQVVFLVLACLSGLIHSGKLAGVSLLCGGSICLVANIFMYRCVFSSIGAQKAKKILTAAYRGEVGKIFLTALCFAVALMAGVFEPAWLFGGYVITQGVFWIFPLCWAVSQNKITTSRMLDE
jgi:F0F1-type ATP synthase assembly protein I